MDECEFCQIVRGQATARVVFDDAETIAFFPLAPAVKGHTLVIPKRHVQDIWSIDDLLASSLAVSTLKVAWGIKRALHPDGMNIINSSGRVASQTVPHLHVHLVPRSEGDNFGDIWPSSEPMDPMAADKLAALIREAV